MTSSRVILSGCRRGVDDEMQQKREFEDRSSAASYGGDLRRRQCAEAASLRSRADLPSMLRSQGMQHLSRVHVDGVQAVRVRRLVLSSMRMAQRMADHEHLVGLWPREGRRLVDDLPWRRRLDAAQETATKPVASAGIVPRLTGHLCVRMQTATMRVASVRVFPLRAGHLCLMATSFERGT